MYFLILVTPRRLKLVWKANINLRGAKLLYEGVCNYASRGWNDGYRSYTLTYAIEQGFLANLLARTREEISINLSLLASLRDEGERYHPRKFQQ